MATNKRDYDPTYYHKDANLAEKYLQIKENAESRGVEFTLSFAHLKRIMKRKTCYYTGRKFSDSPQAYKSVERVRNSEGYTDENTVVVCSVANTLRGDFTLKELQKMVKQIEKHEKKRLQS